MTPYNLFVVTCWVEEIILLTSLVREQVFLKRDYYTGLR